MKLKGLLAGVSALCLAAALLLPIRVHAAGQSSTTTLTTTVPASHTIQLDIGEHGYIEIGGKQYRGNTTVQIKRFAEQEYTIKADKGWQVSSVSYGQENQLKQNELQSEFTFTAPAIFSDDNVLKITWKEAKASGGGSSGSDIQHKGSIVPTGDNSSITIWGLLILMSGTALCYVYNKKKKWRA